MLCQRSNSVLYYNALSIYYPLLKTFVFYASYLYNNENSTDRNDRVKYIVMKNVLEIFMFCIKLDIYFRNHTRQIIYIKLIKVKDQTIQNLIRFKSTWLPYLIEATLSTYGCNSYILHDRFSIPYYSLHFVFHDENIQFLICIFMYEIMKSSMEFYYMCVWCMCVCVVESFNFQVYLTYTVEKPNYVFTN